MSCPGQVSGWLCWVLDAFTVTSVPLLCATLASLLTLAQPSYLSHLHPPIVVEVRPATSSWVLKDSGV